MRSKLRNCQALAALLALVAAMPVAAGPGVCPAGTVVYVNATAVGANSGESWANAFTSLMTALACADSGDQVWVALGTYKTVAPAAPQDRTQTFRMESGVALYGGFLGNETAVDQRPFGYSILDGNIGLQNSSSDNSIHVVTANGVSTTALLDAFIVRNGSTQGGGVSDAEGAGLHAPGGSPTLQNVRFEQNFANNRGGAMAVIGGSPRLNFVIFQSNRAGVGGALAVASNAAPVLDEVFFLTNSSTSLGGGALYVEQASTVRLRDSQFAGNRAEDDLASGGLGGAAYLTGNSTLTCVACGLYNNRAVRGGGAIFGDASSVRLASTRLYGNHLDTAGSGGSVFMRNGGELLSPNSVFGNNIVPVGTSGGAIALQGTNLLLEMSTVSGGVNLSGGAFSLRNSIVWDGGIQAAGAVGQILNADVQGGCPVGVSCTGVIAVPPQFGSPAGADTVPGTPDDDFSPRGAVLDVGDNSLLPPDTYDVDDDGNTTELFPVDIENRPRIADGTIDLGAWEVVKNVFANGFE